MDIPWIHEIPSWLTAVLFVVVLLAALEGGYRIGSRRLRQSGKAEIKSTRDATLGSMLALLGLVLAFTYAFSLSRSDLRKQAVVNEANAIGTAFNKADLLADPGGRELRERLLEYARTRVVRIDLLRTEEDLHQAVIRSQEALSELWPATMKALQDNVPAPIQVSLAQAVNEVLDAHTYRIMVIFDRLPVIVLVLLVLIAAAALATVAYDAALRDSSNRWRMRAFALILAALVLVIVDFDRAKQGFVQVTDHPLETVIQGMESALGH